MVGTCCCASATVNPTRTRGTASLPIMLIRPTEFFHSPLRKGRNSKSPLLEFRMSTHTSEIYDGIILGSGHNSLVLQAYLGKAGLKVLCLESRDVAGGGLATVEDPRHPGFLHNTHSFFHRALTQMPWYRDLELERHGAVYLEPELNVALVLKSGEVLEWWRSFEKTEESFARFSPKDAATLRQWREKIPSHRSENSDSRESISASAQRSTPRVARKERRGEVAAGSERTFAAGVCVEGIPAPGDSGRAFVL